MSISQKYAIRNAIAINNLQICIGSVSNALDSTVKISQDETTRKFIVCVNNQCYFGGDLFEALNNAAAAQ